MPTLLTTSKMHPALAERVRTSVRGRKNVPSASWLRVKSLARFAAVLAIAALAFAVVRTVRRERSAREQARADLLVAARVEAAQVTDDDRASVGRVDEWLARVSSSDEPDVVAGSLRAPDGLPALLARPAVYIRGALASFATPKGIDEVASESSKDTFVSCLFDPPASRTERVVLAKVLAAYPGSAALEQLTPNVRRVGDARAGLPFLSPRWTASVQAASDLPELEELRAKWSKAPLARAKQALRAEVLIAVMDDAASGSGPTELDGERPHDVRVAIVDMRASAVLLRLKKRVDPSWISIPRRPTHSVDLDSCVYAMDVRASVEPAAPATAPTARGKK